MVSRRLDTLAAIAVIVVSVGVVAAAPPIIAPGARRFDHGKHAQVLAASGKGDVPCAACHKANPDDGKPTGGRDHARCTVCHDLERAKQSCDLVKVPGPKSPARQCAICHVATRQECVPSDLPAPPNAPSFVAHFAHGRHITVGGSIEQDCAICHKTEVAGPGASSAASKPSASEGHAACSRCHNGRGAKIAMNQCGACHVAAAAKVARPPDPFALHGFDHAKHRDVASGAGCLGCHGQVGNANDEALPAPSMLGCQHSCHDGKKAFSATGTRCTTCHRASGPPAQQRTDVPFSHAAHEHRNVNIADCAQCHTVAGDGTLLAPGTRKDHQPCANSGCHEAEYANKSTKICGVCHDAQAPWATAISRAGKVDKPEWFQTINHKLHTQIAGIANDACSTCHGDRLAAAAPPAGHRGCAKGGACHGGTQAPAITDCRLCHKTKAPATAPRSAWSVAAAFKHVTHATDPRSHAASRCIECHAAAPAATDLASIPPPAMKLCGGCHDGKVAFKSTGFECVRCHIKRGAAVVSMMEPRR
jgi:c(7)-type cytochrome triheme protein